MAHDHLCFKLVDQVNRHTDQNQYGGAAKPDSLSPGDRTHESSEENNKIQKNGVKPSEPLAGLVNKVRCLSTRTIAGDESSVFLEIVGHFDRLELNH